MPPRYKKSHAFTLIEVLLVSVLLGVLASIVIIALNPTQMILDAKISRANAELKDMAQGFELYHLDNLTWPADASRGNLPTGMDTYLGSWGDPPFNELDSYDWDNYTGSDGNPARQVSIRFCTSGGGSCEYPNASWAAGFGPSSSYYWCLEGVCRAHPGETDSYPGYCVNCY